MGLMCITAVYVNVGLLFAYRDFVCIVIEIFWPSLYTHAGDFAQAWQIRIVQYEEKSSLNCPKVVKNKRLPIESRSPLYADVVPWWMDAEAPQADGSGLVHHHLPTHFS